MIKEITDKQKETKEIGFPKFMISSDGVVIFALKITGIDISGVVVRDAAIYKKGHYSDIWSSSCFSDYNRPITLQNVTE